jgi:hypothetical protein
MSDHNHTGSIWGNVPQGGVNRHSGPGTNFAVIDPHNPLHREQQVIVLCYSLGEPKTFTTPPLPNAPHGVTNTSDAWDFVVTSDQDPGGYVADVYVNTGDDIRQQLGGQGTCEALRNRLPDSQPIG